jgi:hypothetical protein
MTQSCVLLGIVTFLAFCSWLTFSSIRKHGPSLQMVMTIENFLCSMFGFALTVSDVDYDTIRHEVVGTL